MIEHIDESGKPYLASECTEEQLNDILFMMRVAEGFGFTENDTSEAMLATGNFVHDGRSGNLRCIRTH